MGEIVDTEKYTIVLRKNGIMHFHIKSKNEITHGDMHDMLYHVNKIGKGKKFPNLITFEDYVTISREAREFAASEESNIYTTCDAFVVKKTALKLLGNFYLLINKPNSPTKMFEDEESACNWLMQFIV